jgi:hypothetical protein
VRYISPLFLACFCRGSLLIQQTFRTKYSRWGWDGPCVRQAWEADACCIREKPKGKSPLGGPSRRWDDYIKTIMKNGYQCRTVLADTILKARCRFNVLNTRKKFHSETDASKLHSWPLVPKIAGSNPAEAVGFFGRKIPQHAFLQRGSKAVSPCRRFAACERTLWFTWESESRAKLTGHFSLIIPSITNRGLSCRLTWCASGDDGRN